jgi:hypothetical protein
MTTHSAAARFSASDLVLLRAEAEVQIETRASAAAPAHLVVVWVVVDRFDRILIRSYRGATARWYREATAYPMARLHVADRVIDVAVHRADDQERIEACSDGFLRKYAGDSATPAMVADDVVGTTLELTPA